MMHTMANTTGMASGFGLSTLWGLHALGMLLFAIGILFLILWAARTLNHSQLKTWGVGMAVIGVILCFLTFSAGGAMMRSYNDASCNGSTCMMDDDDMMQGGHMMNGGMAGMDHDSMTMGDMVDMLKGKTGDAFDQAFLEGMIPHHQGAVDMANLVLRDAKHEELKQLARDIITSQQKEIDMMEQWQKTWGYAR